MRECNQCRKYAPQMTCKHEREWRIQEKAFFDWWEKVEPYKDMYNLRMAFDEIGRAHV